MSKKSRERARQGAKGWPPKSAPEPAGLAGRPPPQTSNARQITGGRVWCFRLAALTLLPAVLLAVTEVGLRLTGYGYPTQFFLKTDDGSSLITNRRFCWQFYGRGKGTEPHPLIIPAHKPPGTLRIFVLGESAAEGTPDPAFGFARILEIMLAQRFPQTRFEVVNAAMRGINSHIILPIARECAGLDPDLFVVYMGNNEATGLYTPVPGRFNLTPYLRVIRLRQWLKATKTAQLLESLTQGEDAKSPDQTQEFFRQRRLAFDDPQRQPVYENFRQNLNDICYVIQATKAKAILSTVAVNLRDFPPLGSLHRKGLALEETTRWDTACANGIAAEMEGRFEAAAHQYSEAAHLDEHFADLHFHLGRSRLKLGETNAAREHFKLARDWDAMQFRSDSRINDTIRKTVSSRASAELSGFDAEQAFAASPLSEGGLPGTQLFRDHVHFTFDGDYLMATELLGKIEHLLGLNATTNASPSRAECAERLAFTRWDEANVLSAMSGLTSHPPFLDQMEHAPRQRAAEEAVAARYKALTGEELRECNRIYAAAVARAPQDWHLRLNYGGFLASAGQPVRAIEEFQQLVAMVPQEPNFRIKLSNVLARVGRLDDAARQIEEAYRIDPEFPPAKLAIGWARGSKRGGGGPGP